MHIDSVSSGLGATSREAEAQVRPVVDVAVVAAWDEIDDVPCVLLTKRPAGTHLGGYWELPGGKVEHGEAVVAAANRELMEETGLATDQMELIEVVEHDYGDRVVRLHAFLCRAVAVDHEDGPNLPVAHMWIPAAKLESIALPPANRPITLRIMRLLKK